MRSEAERIARDRVRQRHRQCSTGAATLAEANFPNYGIEGWSGRLGGSGSQGRQCTEITANHYDTPYADPVIGDQPRLTVATEVGAVYPRERWSVLATRSRAGCTPTRKSPDGRTRPEPPSRFGPEAGTGNLAPQCSVLCAPSST
jgi:hypothetical protein